MFYEILAGDHLIKLHMNKKSNKTETFDIFATPQEEVMVKPEETHENRTLSPLSTR